MRGAPQPLLNGFFAWFSLGLGRVKIDLRITTIDKVHKEGTWKEKKMKKCGYASKASRIAFAAVLSAGLMLPSGAALADPTGNDVDNASFTLTDIQDGDEVTAYQIFDTSIDANNNIVYTTMVSGLPAEYDSVEKIATYKEGRDVADNIAATVIGTSALQTKATAQNGSATLSLDSGYYLVVVTSNSGNTKVYQTLLVDATPDVQNGAYVTRTISDTKAKSQNVTAPMKKINGKNGFEEIYFVGDEADFEITARVPNYPQDATNAYFSIIDTPSQGLDLLTDTFLVEVGGKQLDPGTDYNIVSNTDGSCEVVFAESVILGNPGGYVSIKLKGKISSIDASSGRVSNNAFIRFASNPYSPGNPVDGDPSNTVQDLTYGFVFQKLAAPDNTPLSGAVFTVTDEAGKPVHYVDANGTLHEDGQVTSDANGYVHVNGLAAGTYTVSETSVPAGYQKVDDFTVELDEDDTDDSPATAVEEKNFKIVENKVDAQVGQLPTTGGAGTIALTTGGILLVVAGSVVVLRRRHQGQD